MSSASDALAELCGRYWTLHCEEFPAEAIAASQPVAHDELLRESPADHARRAQAAGGMLAELQAIAPTALAPGERITHAMLQRDLQTLVESFALRAHLRPSLYPMGPDFLLGYVAGMVALRTEADARRWLARLRSVPGGLQGIVAALEAGRAAGLRLPALVLERAAAQAAALAAMPAAQHPLHAPFVRSAGRFPALEREALQVIETQAAPALLAYAEYIGGPLKAASRPTLRCTDDPDGPALYRLFIRMNTTLDLDPADVHQLGWAEIERIRARMAEVASSAGHGQDLDAYRAALRRDPTQFAAGAEALREQMEVLSKRIDGRLPEFFGHLPRSTYAVRLIPPPLAEKLPPAYAQPNPADNTGPGVHWVTSLPDRLPRYMQLPLALHEAWPGHLMHIALMQELDGLPDFRRHGAMGYSACLEGWALYCERLGEEMGLYDTPDRLYGRLEMEMWRALRLVVDTGIHALGWSREQAIALMERHMAMPRPTIEAEVDRYVGMPAQALAYQIGNRKFCELRERAELRLGERFDRRAFHDALMAAGPVTLDVLDDCIEDWIAQQAGRAVQAA
jgi:uncharacterized protein (DUF885 family)